MKKMNRFLSALVCLSLLFSFCSPVVEAAPQGGTVTTVIACSDFQHEDGNEAGKVVVQEIIEAMKRDGITSADGFLCCGDYDYDLLYDFPESTSREGVDALREAVSGIVTENLIFVQGNHDSGIGTAGMSPSGNNDPASGEYGVFVLNEDDYMWAPIYNGNAEPTVIRTARNLKAYLDEKRTAQYDKPIFVVSHLPLNYNMRTAWEGDGMYANYIFDVLNEAGEAGLNIFFLFGHDHSNGWDDYLGGASIYLTKGDEILIAQASQTVFEAKTLQFTYLNAGYVGYYRNVNGADDALTMTVFQIYDGQVSIIRYDADGRHDLKSAGVTNSYQNESGYLPNTTVRSSPQTVVLTPVAAPVEPPVEHEGPCYTRITNLGELVSGDRYLLICRPDNSWDYYFMLPKVVVKENAAGITRTGFDVEFIPSDVGGTVYGNYAEKEWTFTSASGGWWIGDGSQYAVLTDIGGEVAARLEPVGSVLEIGGSGEYTFGDGTNVFNYNSRGLVNGYSDFPALFYIYKLAGYDVEVVNGSAAPALAAPGEQVTITAGTAPEGQVFDRWEIVSGDVTLSEAESGNPHITITMPAGAVKLRATYRDGSSADPVNPVNPADPMDPGCNHSYGSWEVTIEASCTSRGVMQRVCTICGDIETRRVAPLGHSYSTSWTIDVPATETAVGIKSYHCTRCGARSNITEIPMLARPAETDTIKDDWKQTVLSYKDVSREGWYYTAIQYVVSQRLFVGLSSAEFAPDMVMSRGMLATVLWRMDGSPAVSGYNPFIDVVFDQYYTDAALWARSNDIMFGMGGAKFVPDGAITREQVAVILYRYARKKGYDTTKKEDLMSFPDGGGTSDFAKEALAWAVSEGLIAGVNRGGVLWLDPQGGATRAQVATILMRYQLNIANR